MNHYNVFFQYSFKITLNKVKSTFRFIRIVNEAANDLNRIEVREIFLRFLKFSLQGLKQIISNNIENNYRLH